MIFNAVNHHAVIDPQVVIAALAAAAFLYARFKVTPVADPKDGNGQPLVATQPPPVITVNTTATAPADISRQIAAAVRAYEGRRPGGYVSGGTAVSDLPPPPPSVTAPDEKTLIQPPAAPPE
jgi:hypothetical protein